MLKGTRYRKSLGLFALSLVFSLFAFPGLVSTAEACRPQPQRIEVVADGQNVAEPAVFPYQVTDSAIASNSFQTTRDYEYNVQIVYQRQVKETLHTVLRKSFTFPHLIYSGLQR